ncbi:hypothetical protein HYY72_04475 [Candidatus Woesearchaeota archaeon]|nr:hypothetical protein [Candidatus Woesearchaeota archaeon]
MPKRINTEDAKRILSDCTPDKCFWVNQGPILRNLNELSDALKGINDEQFTHHLNKDKNDFSKWVNDVFGDEELAKALSRVSTKTAAIKKINERIESLKKVAA